METISPAFSRKAGDISNLLLTIAGNIIFYVLLTRGAGLGLTRLSMNPDFITASSAASTIHPAQLSARLDPKKTREDLAVILTPERHVSGNQKLSRQLANRSSRVRAQNRDRIKGRSQGSFQQGVVGKGRGLRRAGTVR